MAATPSRPRTTHFQNGFAEAYHTFEYALPDRPNELNPPTNIPDRSPSEDVPTESALSTSHQREQPIAPTIHLTAKYINEYHYGRSTKTHHPR